MEDPSAPRQLGRSRDPRTAFANPGRLGFPLLPPAYCLVGLHLCVVGCSIDLERGFPLRLGPRADVGGVPRGELVAGDHRADLRSQASCRDAKAFSIRASWVAQLSRRGRHRTVPRLMPSALCVSDPDGNPCCAAGSCGPGTGCILRCWTLGAVSACVRAQNADNFVLS